MSPRDTAKYERDDAATATLDQNSNTTADNKTDDVSTQAGVEFNKGERANRNRRKYLANRARANKTSIPAIDKAVDQAAMSMLALERSMRNPIAHAALARPPWSVPSLDQRSTSMVASPDKPLKSRSSSPSSTSNSSSYIFDRTIDQIADAKLFSDKRSADAKAVMKVDFAGHIMGAMSRIMALNDELQVFLDSAEKNSAGAAMQAGGKRRIVVDQEFSDGEVREEDEIMEEKGDSGSEYEPDS